MVRALFVLLVLWPIVVVAPSVSAATTWYVDDCSGVGTGTTADPFCSIQAAVDAAAAGDTVKVRGGEYTEQVTVDKSLILLGARSGEKATRGRGDPGSEFIVNSPLGSFDLEADDIRLDGFWIHDAFAGGLGANIKMGHFGGHRVVNNVVTGGTIGILLQSDGAAESVITRNRIANNNEAGSAAGSGIYADTSIQNVRIGGNRFINNTSAAVNLAGAPVKTNIRITQNRADSPIILYNTQDSTVSRNVLKDSMGSGIALFDNNDNTSVNRNEITTPIYNGILFRLDLGADPSEGLTVRKNTINGAEFGGGLYLDAGAVDASSFTANKVTGTIGSAGIYVEDGSNDNTFTDNVARRNRDFDIVDNNDDVPVNVFIDNTCGTSQPPSICA